tara:strand:- start:650 stop:895 length:246 start_codon:yes stop_codon:yes gene_type:complete
MSDFKDDRNYGYGDIVTFWSQNWPEGAPRTDKKHKFPPKKPRVEVKKDVLEIMEAMHKKTPLLDFENQKTKLEKDIREGNQ